LGTVKDATLSLRAVVVSLDGVRRLVKVGDAALGDSDRHATARQLGIDSAEALLADGAADVAPLGA